MKILVAMSGGVDSSMSAKFLKDAGYEVEGCYMRLHKKPLYHEENIEKVKKVGEFLGIKTHILDLEDEFDREVFQPFIEIYKSGKTPNPCALCNRTIKFGKFLEFADSLGFGKIATGHYVRVEDGLIKAARDLSKDQSYFLANIEPSVLSRTIFPLGDMLKSDIKANAAKFPELIEIAGQKESSEICFVETTYIDILKSHAKTDIEGIVRDSSGKKIGRHSGYMHYTIGKRRGFSVDVAHEPHYVLKIDAAKNEIIVGKRDELCERFFRTLNFNAFVSLEKIKAMDKIYTKIRYRSQKIEAKILDLSENSTKDGENINLDGLNDSDDNGEKNCNKMVKEPKFSAENNKNSQESIIKNGVSVELLSPANGIASGQLAVFYDEKDRVIASGFIA